MEDVLIPVYVCFLVSQDSQLLICVLFYLSDLTDKMIYVAMIRLVGIMLHISFIILFRNQNVHCAQFYSFMLLLSLFLIYNLNYQLKVSIYYTYICMLMCIHICNHSNCYILKQVLMWFTQHWMCLLCNSGQLTLYLRHSYSV